jgi:uncharacterized protein (DUF1800 family)
MALEPKAEAALALHRFGLGPRPGTIGSTASDPRGAVLAELEREGAGQVAAADLMTAAAANRAVYEFNAARLAKQRVAKAQQEAAEKAAAQPGVAPAMQANATDGDAAPKPNAPPALPLPQQLFLKEAKARVDAAIGSDIGYVERLVWFWSNHFCVNADATVEAGGYEREAIRANVLGKFADMLLAAEGHPAMLLYLDNAQSIGPNSVAGINRNRGLNENLAREILELHTLGVRTVYTQDDVTSFAKVLTGWTIIPTVTNPDHGGEFIFNKRFHEPGPQTLIGKTYPDTGVEQGRAVLADLAHHPSTAKHVATKMARHFIADEPPPPLVDKLTQRFLDTDGDLKEMAKALVTAPESWSPVQAKLKRPGEWTIAMVRAAGFKGDVGRIMRTLVRLGEPVWRPPAPKGFSDDNAAWMDGLALRLDLANAFSQRVAARLDPAEIVETALGPLASQVTRRTIAGAETKPQALTLLLMSPEFQRR